MDDAVFVTDDGWIFVTPVGPEFRVQSLAQEDLQWLLAYAAGTIRPVSDHPHAAPFARAAVVSRGP